MSCLVSVSIAERPAGKDVEGWVSQSHKHIPGSWRGFNRVIKWQTGRSYVVLEGNWYRLVV